MDHQQWLGDTIGRIAAEKAGIIKPEVPVVSAPQVPEAEEVIREAAERAGSALTIVEEPWPGPLPLAGTHQRWNAALAVAAVRAAGFRITDRVAAAGLAATEWPARFQELENGRLIIEGAHNPHGTAAAVTTWKEKFGEEKATVIFGAVAAKDYAASLAVLSGVAARFFFVTLQSPRALAGESLAAAAPAGAEVKVYSSVAEAMAASERLAERTLVCGSLYLCGEVLALRGPGSFEASAQ
jgi:dihydrofolate synthase/folylpolyglutamate synthase